MKLIKYSNSPYKSINWTNFQRYYNLISEKDIESLGYNEIKEVHILGNQKDEMDSGIDSDNYGLYYYKENKQLLCLCDHSIMEIPILDFLNESVITLDIRFTSIESIDLSGYKNIKKLVLSDNPELNRIIGLNELGRLRDLNINFTSVKELPALDSFPNLHSLNIRETLISEIRIEDDNPNCQYIDISKTEITSVAFTKMLPNLRRLSISENKITKLPEMDNFTNLESFNCSGTLINDIPNLENVTSLRSLNISSTEVTSLADKKFPISLKTLILDGLNISHIPKTVTQLTNLNRLSLNEMCLETMPKDIINLNLEFKLDKKGYGINLINTVVEDMDISILKQPRDIIVSWFLHKDDRDEQPDWKLNEAKVVFLGDGGAGKSLSISRLLDGCKKQDEFDGNSTPGISIQDCNYILDGKNILIHYWDFGGQEIMHSMHRMFLTRRTLYVVFINARDNTQDERARYWLHNIKSFANNSPVVLVINQIDQNPSASVNETALRKLYPQLKGIVKLSAVEFSKVEFENNLQREILNEIKKMEIIKEPFLLSWKLLKNQLQQMKENYIDYDRFIELCDKCNVENNDVIRKQLLDWFSDLGVSFFYKDTRKLADYMVLRPDWITNAIYIILFNGLEVSYNGMISHEAIYELLGNKKLGKRVLDELEYSVNETEYVLGVIRKFKLSYLLDDNSEFIPMLCNRNENAIAEEFYDRDDVLEYLIEYQYLPINVIHRLMVEMRNDIKRENVWLTGAVFESKEMGLSALVKIEDIFLKIYVKERNKLFSASTYLGFLRRIIGNINESMGLTASEMIVYKEKGQSDIFDYSGVISSHEYGNKTIYSMKLKRNIEIREIMKLTEGEDNCKREKLASEIYEACGMLQANKIYWSSSEDDRNTYLRDILRSKKYFCADQTLIGKSATGKKPGEVDIEIFESESKPLALIEALNLSRYNNTQKKYWEDHLKKLLDNYNPIGIPELYLISYVECSKDDFKEIWMNYNSHVKSYSCDEYLLQNCNEVVLEKSFYRRVIECHYDRTGFPVTVYNVFVRIGN